MLPNYERIGKNVIEALKREERILLFRHLNELEVSAKFSDNPDNLRLYRYVLEARKSDTIESKTLCAIMQNPSYADEDIADKSVNFLEHLVFDGIVPAFNGVNRLLIVNQFALVQTKGFKGHLNVIGMENDQHIEKCVAEAEIVLIAWGANNKFGERISLVNAIFKRYPDKIYFQTLKHPSRRTLSESFIKPYQI